MESWARKLPSGLVIQIPELVEKRICGPVGFRPVGAGVMAGEGVSGVKVVNSIGCVDSPKGGIFSAVFGKIVGLGVEVAVKRLQATETDRIVNKARICVLFILPPEEKADLIVFLFIQKENPRPEWEEGVVIR
jgi:hypothetical protein